MAASLIQSNCRGKTIQLRGAIDDIIGELLEVHSGDRHDLAATDLLMRILGRGLFIDFRIDGPQSDHGSMFQSN
jgi:hypothetical protein